LDPNTANFNLNVVLRETGIKADTLRAWERRYGLPQPQRTEGGHRLYSQRDIEIVKWLMARQAEGMRISQAVEMFSQAAAQGNDPLIETPTAPNMSSSSSPDKLITELRQSWLEACLAFDETRAEQILSDAFARFPLTTVVLKLILKGLQQIGELWYQGKASVQQEHFTSALVVRRINALIAAVPPPTQPGKVLVGCPPGEEHTISALLISLFLRHRGWPTTYLGANIPPQQMVNTLNTVQPDLVILTALRLDSAAKLLEMADTLQNKHIPLAYGGGIFAQQPQMRDYIPGYYLGDNLKDSIGVAEGVLRMGAIPQEAQKASKAALTALDGFQQARLSIEAQVRSKSEAAGIPINHLNIALDHFSANIEAALRLNNLDYLDHEIGWIKGYLEYQQLPPEFLDDYLGFYADAVTAEMGSGGKIITDWFEK
jgi:methanogenic corrinoid protein MtbC1